MARIRLSSLVTDIRGRIGTQVFSIWKGVNTVRNEPKNYAYAWRSPFNASKRKLVDDCAHYWEYVLTLDQRALWEDYAIYLGTLSGLYGEGGVERMPGLKTYGGPMSGYNAFVLTNALRWSVGKTDIMCDAPLGEIMPSQPVFTAFELVINGTQFLKATYDDPGVFPRTTYVRAWCRGQRFAHLLIAKYEEALTPWQPTWSTMHYAKGVVHILLPDTYECQLDFIDDHGLFSPPSQIRTCKLYDALPGGVWNSFVWNKYSWGGV
jgi:hypothetical protein